MPIPTYLRPYERARKSGKRGVSALLWEGPEDQRVRFGAIMKYCGLHNVRVLDVGCGRAELFSFLLARGIVPSEYIGLEAQHWLARVAQNLHPRGCTIVKGDFVRDPSLLRVGADVVIFSGSLNLLSSRQFYRAIEHGWAAARKALAFNFLCSPALTAAAYLRWHQRGSVLAFASRLAKKVDVDESYEKGDCTVVMKR